MIKLIKIDLEEQNDCLYDYISIEDDEGYEQELESGSFNQPTSSILLVNGDQNFRSNDYIMDGTVDYDVLSLKTRKKRQSTGSNNGEPLFDHVAIEPSFLPYGESVVFLFSLNILSHSLTLTLFLFHARPRCAN